ncbi:MAG: arsenite methyltransferase, partial [Deltaproteobacteria bacterium]|nr:arsenite methyltransferase [Deltaproteobacteria bacterium]
MDKAKNDEIRSAIRQNYEKAAVSGNAGCGCSTSSCCGSPKDSTDISLGLGYSGEDVAAAPEGANMGLGCGNPQAIASLRPG